MGYRAPLRGGDADVSISSVSPVTLGAEFTGLNETIPASNNWVAANTAIFIPLLIGTVMTFQRGWWANGAAVAGNIDVGIYDTAGARLGSTGTVAQAGTSTIQTAAFTAAITLTPGRYYMAMASNTSGVTQKVSANITLPAATARALGMRQMATAFVLPATATYANPTGTFFPLFGISTKTTI